MEYAIELRKISKSFPGVKANDCISLKVKPGEIHAIVGENGAGKTTLMKILYGLYQPDSGEIRINGDKCVFHSPLDAIKKGLGMVHQHFMLFQELSVVENIIYGMEPNLAGFIDLNKARQEVATISNQYNLDVKPDAIVGDLPVGVKQRVEILKALYRRAQIIIFDEPTAVLTPQEQTGFFAILRNLASQGKSIIFITHKLNEVMEISDNVTVMRLGKITANLKTSETDVFEISRNMVGKDILFELDREEVELGKEVLKITDLNVFNYENVHVIKDINMQLYEGEIVGLAGVAGNGQNELIKAITGSSDANYIFGEIFLNGMSILSESIGNRRKQGLSYIPEDRSETGLALQASVSENLLLGNLDNQDLNQNGLINQRNLEKFSLELRDDFMIKTSDVFEKAANLSGGNLQKVVVAREMTNNSKLLIAEQPTRGVDIGAIKLIHIFLLEQRKKGNAILLVSTEMNEILSLSDRILVMFEGRIIGEVSREQADENKLGLMMAGIKE